jgi:hypothetical protein
MTINRIVRTPGVSGLPPDTSDAAMRAVDVVQARRSIMDGVDFVTRLSLSALGKGADFLDVCRQMGVSGNNLGSSARMRIDAAMQQKFDQARQSGPHPVDLATARGWLRELLSQTA